MSDRLRTRDAVRSRGWPVLDADRGTFPPVRYFFTRAGPRPPAAGCAGAAAPAAPGAPPCWLGGVPVSATPPDVAGALGCAGVATLPPLASLTAGASPPASVS